MSLFAIPLFAAHLLCMNVASAGPLLCLWLDHAAGTDPIARNQACWLAKRSWQLALVGAVLGLVFGFLHWNPEYAAVLGNFRRRIHWGAAEFLFSVALVAGYARWLAGTPEPTRAARWTRSLVAFLAATNLLYHFPTLFSLIAGMSSGRIAAKPVDSATFRQLVANHEVWALTAHFLLASIAVSAALVLGRIARDHPLAPGNDDAPDREIGPQVATRVGRVALVATLGQIPVGLWLIAAIPAHSQQRILGGDLVTSALFVTSMAASMSLLHQLGAVSFGENALPTVRKLVLLLLAIVLAMSGVLYRLNH